MSPNSANLKKKKKHQIYHISYIIYIKIQNNNKNKNPIKESQNEKQIP